MKNLRAAAALTAAVVAGALCSGIPAAASAAARPLRPAPGTWGTAEEVPGTAALNKGGVAGVESVSCAAASDCTAVGYYSRSTDNQQAFVVTQTDGTWGKAAQVRGYAALNKGDDGGLTAVSCPTPGGCAAGGLYTDSSDHSQAFVVTESDGRWGKAEEVPGTAALNVGGTAEVTSVSCASAGNCVAGGYYETVSATGPFRPFVASESGGTWGKAQEVPGITALGKGHASISAVSCASAGNCSAGGFYTGSSNHSQAFVVTESDGTWGKAEEVPGTAGLNKGGGAGINSLSCTSAGNCGAGGFYTDSSGHTEAFVVAQAHGSWGTAKEVPGSQALNGGGSAEIWSVSCASAGNCSAGGDYRQPSGHSQPFVVGQSKGTWGKAEEVPGTAGLNKGGNAQTWSVSCASAGNCAAGGYYEDGSGRLQAFVVSQTGGTWATAEEVPGTAALNKDGDASVEWVSCAAPGNCAAGGSYEDGSGHVQAFVVSQTPAAGAAR